MTLGIPASPANLGDLELSYICAPFYALDLSSHGLFELPSRSAPMKSEDPEDVGYKLFQA